MYWMQPTEWTKCICIKSTVNSFYSFLNSRHTVSKEKYSNELVCRKWNSQQISVDQNKWTTSRGDPEYSKWKNLCFGVMENTCSLSGSVHCSMASKVMESFHLFFHLYQLCMLLNQQNLVVASEVNESVVTEWHFISWQLGSQDS